MSLFLDAKARRPNELQNLEAIEELRKNLRASGEQEVATNNQTSKFLCFVHYNSRNVLLP